MINCPVCKHPHEDKLSDRLPALATDLCCSCQASIDGLVGWHSMAGDSIFDPDPDNDNKPMFSYTKVSDTRVINWFIHRFSFTVRNPKAERCQAAVYGIDNRCRSITTLRERDGLMLCGSHYNQKHLKKAYWQYPENKIPDVKKITCLKDIDDIETVPDMLLALQFLLSENIKLNTDRNGNRG